MMASAAAGGFGGVGGWDVAELGHVIGGVMVLSLVLVSRRFCFLLSLLWFGGGVGCWRGFSECGRNERAVGGEGLGEGVCAWDKSSGEVGGRGSDGDDGRCQEICSGHHGRVFP